MTADSISLGERLKLATLLQRNGLSLDSHQIETLALYAELLREWNSKVNLISRKNEENIWTSHILHSLSLLFFLDLPSGIQVLDLGTGGGLPGIPLAIARPDIHVTLVDSIRKKTAAVEAMIYKLPLGNVRVITSRVEELVKAREEGRRYNLIVSRAVAPLSDLMKWTKGLYDRSRVLPVAVRTHGIGQGFKTPLLVAFKGGDLKSELHETRSRFPAVAVRGIPLVFEGSDRGEFEGKTLLITEVFHHI